MSDLMTIGASATKAYRAKMAAISENIANAENADFTKRTVTLAESSVSSATSPFTTPGAVFGGVQITGVGRGNDPFLDATVRVTEGALGAASSRSNWLEQTESAIADDSTGVGSRLNATFAAGEALAGSSFDRTLRTEFLYRAEETATSFQTTAANLARVSDGQAASASADVEVVNDALGELARINQALRKTQPNSSAEVQLLDSRDAALLAVSQRLDANITFGDRGTVSLDFGGETILDTDVQASFASAQNADGTISLSVDGKAVAAPGSGTLAGTISAAAKTAGSISDLNKLAKQFADDLNNWNQQGLTDDGNAGGALLSYDPDNPAGSLVLISQDTSLIAAASKDASGTVTSNGNLLSLSALRGTNGVEENWTQLVATNARQLSSANAEESAAASRNDEARKARESVSGVDLDVQAADLLRIQQAYEASAKILGVARDTLTSILDIM